MFEHVTDDTALARLCERLSGRDWLALDTEFVRERTYHPRLCLLQVADRGGLVACIDPLSIGDLEPLLELLWRDDVTKVLHAAGQDLELLYAQRGTLPNGIFDTQVAAALVGHDGQSGYAALVESRLSVKLDKAHTRTDWSKRPLSRPELEYAADDVRYLPALFDDLHAALVRRGRFQWAVDESRVLADPARYEVRPDDAWRRVKGGRDLDAGARAALCALAAWRERTAVAQDRPRQWVLRDEQLVALARARPGGTDGIAAIEGMPAAVVRKHTDELLCAIDSATTAQGGDPGPPAPALDNAGRARVDSMMRRIRARSAELGIAPAMLATRRECEALVRGESGLSVLAGWRRELIGDELLALSAGA